MRLQFGLGQNALDGAAADILVVRVVDNPRGQITQRPMGHRSVHVGGLGGGQDDNLVAVFRGKRGRAAATGKVVKTVETLPLEAAAPATDGVGIAAQFEGDLQVGGLIGLVQRRTIRARATRP